MSKLFVNQIDGIASGNVEILSPLQAAGITSSAAITASAGIALGGNITGPHEIGTDGSKVSEVNVSGTVYAQTIATTDGSINNLTGTTVDVSGQIDADSIEIGDPVDAGGTAATSGCLSVKNQATVCNIGGSASTTALAVTSGKVDASSSEVMVQTLTVGGTNYTATDFSNFGSSSGGSSTNYVKAFCKIPYDFNVADHNAAFSGGFNVNTVAQDTSEFTLQVNFTSTISDPIVTFSSTQDGEDIADGSKQLAWYVSNESTGSITLKLRNGETNDSGNLYFQVVDA